MRKPQRRKVFVTGMGAVSAAGIGVDPLWTAARTGRSAIGEAQFRRAGPNRVNIAAQVRDFDPEAHIDSKLLPFCDRFSQFAIVAADEAMRQAGLADERLGPRAAVIIGTGIGGITTVEDVCYADFELQRRVEPLAVPRIMAGAASSHVAMRYGCTGPVFGVTSACASAAQAIGIGASLIRAGAVDRAIVGGSEATITPLNIRVWEMLRVLAPQCTRPFSAGRDGMVLGEGAAVLVLEAPEAAQTRDAAPLAELAGYGTSSNADDIVRPDTEGAVSALRLALADSGLAPEQIDYINAHGTGTIAGDASEAAALRCVFGSGAARLPVSSTKPIHGHTLGAAGAIELVVTISALQERIAPPTINWLGPDPKIALDTIPNAARAVPIAAAMSNSFAFGGINACLIVTAPD